ncbi:MAG: segregation and condensation protein A [Dehalococcoidia bacterium]
MFQLRLPAFHGPLDLLLRLVEEAKLDITAVSLVQVTDQYLAHLRQAHTTDASALAEFILIGAKLLYLKSCALLPQPPSPVRREAAAVGQELSQMLQEYRRFREAAQALRQLEEQGQRAYPRLTPPPFQLPPGLKGVTLELLLDIFQEALSRQPPPLPEEAAVLQREPITVEEKVAAIAADLVRQGRLSFRAVVTACRSRAEVVAAFLAVLELIKGGRAWAEQEEAFADISLVALPDTQQAPSQRPEGVEQPPR